MSDLDLCVALQVLRDAGKPDLAITVRDELDRLRAANARLAAECGRKQEWIDAVMGQPSFTNKYTYIRRPQPLVKE